MSQGERPTKVLKRGRVRCAIWIKQGDDGRPWASVLFSRRYPKGDDFETTTSFNAGDLLAIEKLSSLADDWCSEHVQEEAVAFEE